MKIAINGCCHGELDILYKTINKIKEEKNINIDLLICCGDFESIRTEEDLLYFCAPPKYKKIKDFIYYYKQEKKAPILTILIGGNHEAPNVLRELYYGGWLAPNIFYLGHSGVIKVGGIRIAGLSGIYDKHHYNLGHFERPPYDSNTMRSAYHVRQFELMKLHCIEEPVDIMLSHDWPEGVYNYGNKKELIKKKPAFIDDINRHNLGSPPSMALLKSMQPSFWFSGHLHVYFSALITHANKKETRFMALDKIINKRSFIHILDIHPNLLYTNNTKYIKYPSSSTNIHTPLMIEYDVEWLSILRANQRLIPTSRFPTNAHAVHPTEEDRKFVINKLKEMIKQRQEEKEEKEKEKEKQEKKEKQKDKEEEKDKEEKKKEEKEEEKEQEQEEKKEEKKEEEKEEEIYPWPHWSNPSFIDLKLQRKFLLNLIGMNNYDLFDDSPPTEEGFNKEEKGEKEEKKDLSSSFINKSISSPPPLRKPQQEEITLDLDDL